MGEVLTMVGTDLRDQFSEQGFVRVPQLLDPDELARFAPVVDEGMQARLTGDTRALEEKTTYEQSFQQCLNLWEDVPAIRPLTFHPHLGAAAAALLDVSTVRIWHDQALYKEPGGRGTDPHQDQPYWPIVEPKTVTAWIPLLDVDLEMGAMGYVPGSHRFGVRKYANIFRGRGLDLEEGPEARGVPPVFVPAEVGDVVFHHGLTIHTAGANDTGEVRRVYTVIFFADGCTRAAAPEEHPSVDRGGIAAGAPIASTVTPIAYPRPEGDLPETPAPSPKPKPGWPGWDWARYLRKRAR
jgi:ectoine hydroxylase-related dioxygenase (phytanoyl-CoA dioxygenase family)